MGVSVQTQVFQDLTLGTCWTLFIDQSVSWILLHWSRSHWYEKSQAIGNTLTCSSLRTECTLFQLTRSMYYCIFLVLENGTRCTLFPLKTSQIASRILLFVWFVTKYLQWFMICIGIHFIYKQSTGMKEKWKSLHLKYSSLYTWWRLFFDWALRKDVGWLKNLSAIDKSRPE